MPTSEVARGRETSADRQSNKVRFNKQFNPQKRNYIKIKPHELDPLESTDTVNSKCPCKRFTTEIDGV